VLAEHTKAVPNKPSALVFTNDNGDAVAHGPFYRNHYTPGGLARATRARGPSPFHDLRHSYISTLIARSGDVKTVATLAGHASPVMTLTRYAHVFPDATDKAAIELDAAYAEAAEPAVVKLKRAS